MEFADYASFRSSVRFALDAANPAPQARPDEVLDMAIAMGEARVHRTLRASTMLSDLSVAVASNAAALPADLLELRSIHFAGEAPIELIPLDRFVLLDSVGGGGAPRYAAQDADALVFYPEASGTLLGSYYARPVALRDVTWAQATTFARYPEVYLHAALAEGKALVGLDPTISEAKFRETLESAMQDERARTYSAGRLRVRAR